MEKMKNCLGYINPLFPIEYALAFVSDGKQGLVDVKGSKNPDILLAGYGAITEAFFNLIKLDDETEVSYKKQAEVAMDIAERVIKTASQRVFGEMGDE